MWTGLDASQLRIRFRTRCGKPEMQMQISFVFLKIKKKIQNVVILKKISSNEHLKGIFK